MNSTSPPTSRITVGPSTAVSVPSVSSSSRCWWRAAWSSISSSRPDFSPLAISRTATGGNRPDSASERAKLPPSRTRTAARLSESCIGRLWMVCAASASASSTGTPLAISVASVRVARAVSAPRASRPNSGSFSTKRSQASRTWSRRSAKRNPANASAATMSAASPNARTASATAMRMRVTSGSCWLRFWNTVTTCGTTYTSRPLTIAIATTSSSSG